jgi:hypothetical protein
MWARACLVFVCLAFGGVAPASAACTQVDLRGLWDVYAAGAALEAFWVRCVIRIQASGVIVPVQSNLRQATLARDKDLLVGVGTGPTGSIFLFNAIRR